MTKSAISGFEIGCQWEIFFRMFYFLVKVIDVTGIGKKGDEYLFYLNVRSLGMVYLES